MNKATYKQTWALFLSTGVDCRNASISVEEAAELFMLANKDPAKVKNILVSKGGEFKQPKNLERSLKKLESKGKVFNIKKQKSSKQDSVDLILNHKKDEKIRVVIFKRAKELIEGGNDFRKTAIILNKENYRCCDGSEWGSKSVYDFYRRMKSDGRAISINEIKEEICDDDAMLMALLSCNIKNELKKEIIKKIYS